MAALAERGTLVAPDVVDVLTDVDADHARRALLERSELPFMLTREHIAALLDGTPPAEPESGAATQQQPAAGVEPESVPPAEPPATTAAAPTTTIGPGVTSPPPQAPAAAQARPASAGPAPQPPALSGLADGPAPEAAAQPKGQAPAPAPARPPQEAAPTQAPPQVPPQPPPQAPPQAPPVDPLTPRADPPTEPEHQAPQEPAPAVPRVDAAAIVEPRSVASAAAAPAAVREVAPFTPDQRGSMFDQPGIASAARPLAEVAPDMVRPHRDARPARDTFDHTFEVLSDVTGNSTCEGAITDFTRYFTDRLAKLRKVLRTRRELAGHVPIRNARQGGQAEIKIIGLVTEVRSTKNGHKLIEVEDETGSANVLAPANSPHLVTEAGTLVEDEVAGFICKPAGRGGDLLILDRMFRPDVPFAGDKRTSERGSAVAFLSDLHFGSKTFLADDWERFIKWINGDWGDSRMKAMARKTKYLVVNGDIVDGIGIFPGQEDELSIPDGQAQYEFAGQEFMRIPDDIKIFMLPGNHDLVRPAEPQPALPQKYQKLFPDTITQLGNPVKLSIEGVEVLNYHGRSMDDWITRVQGLSYEKPIEAMREMLTRRHVCPVYGLRTPIAPEHKDFLVVDTVPDIFVTGHVHSAGIDHYRGVTLINASCWQAQTSYQKMHGFQPEPGKVAVVELDSAKSWMLDFHRGKPAGIDVTGKSKLGKPDPKVKPEF